MAVSTRLRGVLWAALTGAVLALPLAAHAQQGSVSGRVTDAATDAPLSGVSVVIEGTQLGTLTGSDGTYTISGVPVGTQRVTAALIGYASQTQPVAVTAGATVEAHFALESEAIELEGLVAVGYSTRQEQQITSAVQQVTESELRDVTAASVNTMLQGKTAGVFITGGSGDPAANPTVRIRGTGSVTAGSGPLIVVDGVIGGMVDPYDVESVTVLKDAAATALYGSRAANGVIVITTKQGRRGATRVDVSSSYGVSRRNDGNFSLMSSAELYELLHDRMGVTAFGNRTLGPDLLERNTDWLDYGFRTGRTSRLDVAVSGGDDRTRFYLSGNWYDEEGTLIETGLERVGARLNLEHAVNDRLTVTARINVREDDDRNNPESTTYGAYTYLPWDYPYNEDGSIRTGREPDWLGRDKTNFLYGLQYNDSRDHYRRISGDVMLRYDFTPWLNFTTTNRYGTTDHRWKSNADPRTPAGSTLGGLLTNGLVQSESQLSSNLLRLNYDTGPHTFGGILGVEYQRDAYDGFNARGAGIFPGFGVLDAAAGADNVGGSRGESVFHSGLFQGDYDYNDTYFATVSFRRDGSSRFGRSNRYGSFYSLSGGWMLSNEPFLRDVSAVDMLKLRASYGTTGNADIGDYLWRGLYGFTSQYNGEPAAQPIQLENPDLTWEVARTLNVGVDARLFDRFDLSLDAYRRVNDDLLLNVTLPGTSGVNSIVRNIGSIENRGIELSISTPLLQGPLLWTTDFNIGFNRNKVLALNEGEDIPNGNQRISEGYDLQTWYMRKWVGVDPENGDPLWEVVNYGPDGEVISRETTNDYNAATLQRVGKASPDFTGGWVNDLSYGPLSLRATFSFVSGNLIYHQAREYFDSDGGYIDFNYMRLADGWSRWEKPGDRATHPKPIPGGNRLAHRPSSRYLEDGSYLRLNNVTLSYQLPDGLLRNVNAATGRLYLAADHVYTWTEFSGLDPEAGIGGTVSSGFYPRNQKLLIGLDLGL
ncbi:MAG TPA: SusC/RagA family TonB-linked outer membrane protein [Longimicrobiaceae bacterium]